MKNNTMKKAILSKVALIAFTITAFMPVLANNHHLSNIDSIIHVFIPAERNLAGFVNENNKTLYKTFLEELRTILRDYKRKVEAVTRSHNDDISVAIDELMDYVAQHFNILCDVLERYNGKPATYALDLAAEIERDFNTEKIFGEMIAKLKVLHTKAAHADHKHLVKKVDCLMQLIQKKRTEWKAKNRLALFSGLRVRMSCH